MSETDIEIKADAEQDIIIQKTEVTPELNPEKIQTPIPLKPEQLKPDLSLDIKIRPFDEYLIQDLKIMQEMNNAYVGLLNQELPTKQDIKNTDELIKMCIAHPEWFTNHLINIPFAIGGFRALTIGDKKDFISSYTERMKIFNNKLLSIITQREHRGNEWGMQKIKVLRGLYTNIKLQHGFNDEELINLMSEKPTLIMRYNDDLDKTIQKAEEVKPV